MPVPIPSVHIGIGVVTSLISIPLILRWIPMNRFYGVRIPASFSSKKSWYAINAYGGWWLFGWGLFLIAVGILGRRYAPPPTSPWAPVYLVVPLLTLAPVIVAILSYRRRNDPDSRN